MTEKIIEPRHGSFVRNFADVWRHRELLGVLVWRGIATRYRQMVLGPLWMVLEPLALLAMMTVVFGLILKLPTDGYPFPVFAYAALVPFMLFSKTASSVADCLRENMGLISKVYFPRLLLPLVSVARELFDAGISIVLIILVSWVYGFVPTAKLLMLPFFMMLAVASALAIGLWVAAAMVKFRDIRHGLTIILQLWMYATPIVYSASVVPAWLLPFYKLNPLFWVVEGFRWVLLGKPFEFGGSFALSVAIVAAGLISGLFVFNHFERLAVDTQ